MMTGKTLGCAIGMATAGCANCGWCSIICGCGADIMCISRAAGATPPPPSFISWMDLRAHAPVDHRGEGVGDAVEDRRGFAERVVEQREHVADARGHLQAVRALDDLVVDRVGPQLLRLHHVDARDRDGQDGQQHASRHRPTSDPGQQSARGDAADRAEVSLAALEIPDAVAVLIQGLFAQVAAGEGEERARGARAAAERLRAARLVEGVLNGCGLCHHEQLVVLGPRRPLRPHLGRPVGRKAQAHRASPSVARPPRSVLVWYRVSPSHNTGRAKLVFSPLMSGWISGALA